MAIRARVGRHARNGGRQCQNWADDQQTVSGLLNRIPTEKGGTQGGLNGRFTAGICSDPLYGAILLFENKYFPGQGNGFVDPASMMLKRMEDLAEPGGNGAPAASKNQTAAETPLDILRRNVLDDSLGKSRWTAGERIAFDPLVKLAVQHIDVLKAKGYQKLPWAVEMFGRAYITREDPMAQITDQGLKIWFTEDSKKEPGAVDPPPLPSMSYGFPVNENSYITTAQFGAFLLYATGDSVRVGPYHRGSIKNMRYSSVYKDDYLLPKPLDGAKEHGLIG